MNVASLGRRSDPRWPAIEALTQAACRYLGRCDRTEAHVRAYLARLGASATQTDAILVRLRTSGYVDDRAYARRWAHERLLRKPMGRERMSAELNAKGVTEAVIRETLDDLYRVLDERDLARQVVAQHGAQPALLRRRGFTEDTIESVCGMESHPRTGREQVTRMRVGRRAPCE